jgi:hypothetical protein
VSPTSWTLEAIIASLTRLVLFRFLVHISRSELEDEASSESESDSDSEGDDENDERASTTRRRQARSRRGSVSSVTSLASSAGRRASVIISRSIKGAVGLLKHIPTGPKTGSQDVDDDCDDQSSNHDDGVGMSDDSDEIVSTSRDHTRREQHVSDEQSERLDCLQDSERFDGSDGHVAKQDECMDDRQNIDN